MMSLRFTSLLTAACVALCFLGGCDDTNNKQQQSQTQSTTLSSDSSAAVDSTASTDEQVDGAEVSLTKNYYFVLDGSGSMDDCPPVTANQRNCIPKIKGAVSAIRHTIAQLPNDVNVGLYVFDRDGDFERVPLGLIDRPKLEAVLSKVRADNGTPLGAAVVKGVNALEAQKKKQMGFGDYALMIVTDGEASDSLDGATALIQKTLTPTYLIGFGIGEDHALRKYSLHYWAADTGDQVQAALTSVLAEGNADDPSHFKKK